MKKGCSVSDMGTPGIGLLLVLVFGHSRGLLEDEICPRKHNALLIALLPLHEGDNCRRLTQKGVQQKVALETSLEIVNSENDLPIGLKILDTCSDRRKAAESAGRAVAFARKRCSKLPLFLGLLGPDDEESLKAVLGTYEFSQVIPAADSGFRLFNAINVVTVDVAERARRLTAFLKYLNWHSFILIFTSDGVSSRIAISLLDSDKFCLTDSVLRLPSFGSGLKDRAAINRLRRTVEEANDVRIVIITDDANVMDYFTDYVEDNWGDYEYVVYAEKSGILPWRGSKKLAQNMIVLQEVPRLPMVMNDFEDVLRNSTLWGEFTRTEPCEGCGSFKPRADPTVVPYVYSLHLLSRALKTATRRKCGKGLICDALREMPPAEWRAILEDTVTVVDDSRVSFYMPTESVVEIYARGEAGFEVVGEIEEDVIVYRSDAVNRSGRSRAKQCMVDMYQFELETETTTTTAAKPEETTVPVERRVPLDFGYHELMATVIGFPIGLVLLIALTAVCVCRSFRSGSEFPKKSSSRGDYS
ncbi:UNVERIFIED_CONTAM: hypothetical protein PYX00_004275 [Menopon gallinae]|uniref:Receptor ligand binding region domain-containing protein n=1 Tax=Menopon gallinae TaxID=328185 RepID=A0AAW2I5M0_9NEOP